MNGQDWLNYWQAQQKPEDRKADWLDSAGALVGGALGALGGPPGMAAGAALGKAAGGTAEDAVNGGVTLQDLMRLGMAAGPVMMPFNLGFAAGGSVPDVTDPMFQQAAMGPAAQPQGPTIRTPQDAADFLRGLEDAMGAMPGGTFTQEKPKHPTLEMLASVVPDVVKALPAPRQTNSVNKTIGAWLPAAATAFSAPINYGKAQREERNKRGSEAAKALADHRWSVARSLVDSLDTRKGDVAAKAQEPMVSVPGVGDVPATSGLARGYLEKTRPELFPKPVSEVAKDQQQSQEANDVEALARSIVNHESLPEVPTQGRSAQFGAKVQNRVNELLRGSGMDYAKLRLLYNQAKKFNDTVNSQRFVQLRQSAGTVRQHLDQFEEFYNKYQQRYAGLPMHVKPFARGVYGAAKAGLLGPEAQADAEAIGLTGSVLGREAAMVFSGGFAPYEKDVQDAKREISALLGPKANKATVGALKRLLEARIQKATKALPFAGGKDNPYQLEPTPLDEWNRLAEPTADAKASGSLPPGAKEVR